MKAFLACNIETQPRRGTYQAHACVCCTRGDRCPSHFWFCSTVLTKKRELRLSAFSLRAAPFRTTHALGESSLCFVARLGGISVFTSGHRKLWLPEHPRTLTSPDTTLPFFLQGRAVLFPMSRLVAGLVALATSGAHGVVLRRSTVQVCAVGLLVGAVGV